MTWLEGGMEQGISSVSLNPDTAIDTWLKFLKKSQTSKYRPNDDNRPMGGFFI